MRLTENCLSFVDKTENLCAAGDGLNPGLSVLVSQLIFAVRFKKFVGRIIMEL